MNLIAILAFVICLAEASQKQNHDSLTRNNLTTSMEEKIITPRIVNGQLAHPNQFPYMVGLHTEDRTGEYEFCGGAIIGQTWILTAAHCLLRKRSAILYLGSIQQQEGLTYYNIKSQDMIPHPDFHLVNNDIGLVRVPPVPYSRAIRPIALPGNRFNLDFNSITTIMGWGLNSTHGYHSDTLLYTDVRVISNEHCSSFYPSIDNMKLCSESHLGGGPCNGDSGGPLVLKSQQVLVGILSFSAVEGCVTGKPDVYSRITSYLDWIRSETGI